MVVILSLVFFGQDFYDNQDFNIKTESYNRENGTITEERPCLVVFS